LGLGSEVGTITAGAVADMLVIDGDPLADVRVLRDPERIAMVVQGGEVVAGKAVARKVVAGGSLTPA
ncbi:MAG TPA: amidohydrolase family protein, partial [Solirubrobacteraceae bacterium]|nr:amidohydrolase family protein [Solirubrobacteraceae bacterium]